jgi:hypothetical protein
MINFQVKRTLKAITVRSRPSQWKMIFCASLSGNEALIGVLLNGKPPPAEATKQPAAAAIV